jgi:hypothetical protein
VETSIGIRLEEILVSEKWGDHELVVGSLGQLIRHYHNFGKDVELKTSVLKQVTTSLSSLLDDHGRDFFHQNEAYHLNLVELLGHCIFHTANYESLYEEFVHDNGLELIQSLIRKDYSARFSLLLLQLLKLITKSSTNSSDQASSLVMVQLLGDSSLSDSLRLNVLSVVIDLLRSAQNDPPETKILDDFRASNGIMMLVDLLKSTNHYICIAAFYCLAEAIANSLQNKLYIGEKIGFLELARILQSRSSLLHLDEFFFEVMFELATTGSFKQKVLNLPHRISEVLNTSQGIEDHVHRLESDQYSLHSHVLPLENKLRRVAAARTNPSTPVVGGPSSFFRSPSPAPGLKHIASEPSIAHLAEGLVNPTGLRVVMPKPIAKSISTKSIHLPDESLGLNDSSDSLRHSASRDFDDLEQKAGDVSEDLSQTEVSTTTKFHSTEASLMIVLLMPNASMDVQRVVINRLSLLLNSNPCNMRSLCEMHVLSFLIRLAPLFADSLHSSYFQLIASLGSYDVTEKEARLLFDLALLDNTTGDVETRRCFQELVMQMFYVIGRLAERTAPNVYFNFSGNGDGLKLPPIAKFPLPKSGYSFCCWFKITSFLSPQTSFFSWIDNENEVALDVFFSSSSKLSRGSRYLCFRSSQVDVIEFDSFGFEEGSLWYFLAVTHTKQSVTIFVNGRQLDQCYSPGYPEKVSKTRPLLGHLGCCTTSPLHTRFSSFCGLIGNFNIFEGTLDAKQVEAMWLQGASFSGPLKTVNIDLRRLLTIDPNDALIHTPRRARERLGTLVVSPRNTDNPDKADFFIANSPRSFTSVEGIRVSPTFFEDRNTNVSSGDASSTIQGAERSLSLNIFDSTSPAEMFLGSDVHITHSIRDEIRKIGGPFLCLLFLSRGNVHQVNGIRILGLLLDKAEENTKIFESSRGFEMLSYLLQTRPSSELTMDTFDVLVDILVGNMRLYRDYSPRYFRRSSCLIIILDLLRICDSGDRLKVITQLADMVSESSANTEVWRQHAGVFGTVDLLRLSPDSISAVSLIIDSFLKSCESEELERLMCYLVTVENEFIQEKALICDRLFRAICRRPLLLPQLLKIDGFMLLFSMLESPSESTRVNALKIIGMCLTDSAKSKTLFVRYQGFDVMLKLLSTREIHRSICSALVKIALDEYIAKGDLSFSSMSPSEDNEKESKNNAPLIMNAEAVRVAMLLVSRSVEHGLHIELFDQLDALLENNQNLEILLQGDWLQWCQQYYDAAEKIVFLNDLEGKLKERVLSRFVSMVQKTILYDMSCNYRASRLGKLKDLSEAEQFQVIVIESVLSYFESHPGLEEPNAANVVRNLVQLYEHVDEIVGLTPDVCVRIINSINLMASQNPDAIRTLLKVNGVFVIRDNLVLHFIRDSVAPHDNLYDAFNNLSFETVAANPQFRNSQGCLYILKIFHEAQDFDLQVLIAEILRDQLGPHEENRKELIRIVSDIDVLISLLPDLDMEDLKSANVNQTMCFPPDEPEPIDPSTLSPDENIDGCEDFVNWYFAPEQDEKRKGVLMRLEAAIAPTEAKLKKNRDAVAIRKQKRLKQRLEKLERAKIAADKASSEVIERINARVTKCCKDYATAQQLAVESRLKRIQVGEDEWTKKRQELENLQTKWLDLGPTGITESKDEEKVAQPSKVDSPGIEAVSLKCTLCTYTSNSHWEIICHSRLDH